MTFELFPELSAEVLGGVLSNHARLQVSDDISLETARTLNSMGLIDIVTQEYTLCVNDEDPDYFSLSADQYSCDGEIDIGQDVCPSCGRQIDNQYAKQHFNATYIELRLQSFAAYIEAAIKELPDIADVERASSSKFRVTLSNGRILSVILLSNSTEISEKYEGIYFGGAHLYIYFATYDRPLTTLLSENYVLWLGDFLSLSPFNIAQRFLIAASQPLNIGRFELSQYEKLFDTYITGSWQDFEKRFVPELMERIIQNPKRLELYLTDLQGLSQTLLGSFSVSIGGAGKTDIRFISKYEYVSTIFHPHNIADGKRYASSSLRAEDVIKVLNHMMQIPFQQKLSAVIFAATNEIQSGAWANICSYRDSQGYWLIVILPRYLIIELLVVFDSIDLIM